MGHRSFFIDIEGPDGAGKKTQSNLIKKWLDELGYATTVTSFPDYETEIGREIKEFLYGRRRYPFEVAHILFAANRWEKKDYIKALLSSNDFIIVNRYTASNIVYGTANGLDREWLWNLERGLPRPDLTIVLDVDPEVAKARKEKRTDSYEKDLDLQKEVRRIYLDFAHIYNWAIVDANKTIHKVHNSIKDVLTERFLKGAR